MSAEREEQLVRVPDGVLRVETAGDPEAPVVLFAHGWPEDASAWRRVVDHLADDHRCLAPDLPGIGGSTYDDPQGDTAWLAGQLRALVIELGLEEVTLVGHDIGGMTTFAYLAEHADLRAAMIMDVVIPGLEPWDEVVANPYVWHFAFHSIPDLPEALVSGRERRYFDFFYDVISADPAAITEADRERYVAAYANPVALRQGFAYYRAFPQDVEANRAVTGPITTPLHYVRGEAEGGDLDAYRRGFESAGVQQITTAQISGGGHFLPEEQPAAVADEIRALVARTA